MSSIDHLLKIMERLRNKETGCPWDVEQTFETIAPHTIEEAYEVVDAIERKDHIGLKEELGDLLLQVVFHAQIAQEAGLFSFDDVVKEVSDKLERRHPHVFGLGKKIKTAAAQMDSWEKIKADEKRGKLGLMPASILDDIPLSLPSMARAYKILKRASKQGFDWPDLPPVFDKLQEEIGELRTAINNGSKEEITDEVGDVLFVTANIAKHLKIDPEVALRQTMKKFERRFRFMENLLEQRQQAFTDMSLQQLDELWDQAKAMERL